MVSSSAAAAAVGVSTPEEGVASEVATGGEHAGRRASEVRRALQRASLEKEALKHLKNKVDARPSEVSMVPLSRR